MPYSQYLGTTLTETLFNQSVIGASGTDGESELLKGKEIPQLIS